MRYFLPFLFVFSAHAYVTTPNMSLSQPTIGVDTGLTWEQLMNSNASTIDSHNHTPGNGVQIPPNGLNINGPLTFQNNSATNLQSSVYQPQAASLPQIDALYVISKDLYYNDGNSNVIQITSGGSLAVTGSSISDGSGNSAAFSGGVLVVQNTSTQPDNIQVASVLLGNATPSSNYLTLNPPSSMAANISETLPTLPLVPSIVQMASNGVMSAALTVDGTTLANSGTSLSVANGGIGTTQLASGAVTYPKIGTSNIVFSSSTGAFTTSATSPATITNASVTITTSGHPVDIYLQSDGTVSAIVGIIYANTANGIIYVERGGSGIAAYQFGADINLPCPIIRYTDNPSAGTYTYSLKGYLFSSGTLGVTDCVLVAKEEP